MSRPENAPNIVFVNRSYWPDVEATGQLLGELCMALAATYRVDVVAGVPNLAASEHHGISPGTYDSHGVSVTRVATRRFQKTSLISRGVGLLSYLAGAAWVLFRKSRPAVLVVETDPPMLLALGTLLKFWHRRALVVYLQDLHPEVGLALGKFRPGLLTFMLRAITQMGLQHADRVVVLGEDMKRVVLARGVPASRIAIIPNWADTTLLTPGPVSVALRRQWGVTEPFVVMYSGNLGLSQNLAAVLEAAAMLKDQPIAFVFVGEGAMKAELMMRAEKLGLAKVSFHPYVAKDQLRESLGAADLHLITLQKGLAGFIVPSKLYGILAVGRPYIAAVDAASDTATVTVEHQCGVRVEPDSAAALAQAIRDCAANPAACQAMGERGRRVAETIFDRDHAVAKFRKLLDSLIPRRALR